MSQQRHEETLEQALSHILEEARMMLPGIQAIFGFQLIAVFNNTFYERLSDAEQALHVAALALVALSSGLTMAPAAYHRQVHPRAITDRFVTLATVLLTVALFPLMTALSMDFYLIVRMVSGQRDLAMGSAAALWGMFAVLWYVWPWVARARDRR